VVVFLIERKNKERCITAHNIKRGGKILELGEEFSSYDKVKDNSFFLKKTHFFTICETTSHLWSLKEYVLNSL